MARQTKGRLYKSGKKGAFHLQYYVNGKEFKLTLKDEAGNIITNEKAARIAAESILHPVKAENKAEQLRQVLDAVESAEAKAARLEQEQKEAQEREAEAKKDAKATLVAGWDIFMDCPKRPASCKRFPKDAIPRTSTIANYRAYCKKFCSWMAKHYSSVRLLSEVTPESAAAFMEHVRYSGAAGTYNKYLQFFNMFYRTLNDAGKIKCGNPFKDIDRMENRYHSKKPLSLEQIAKLISSASGEMRLIVALGYFTGLRFGDCCTLLWQEVDLLRGVIERVPRKTEHTVKDIQQAIVKVGIPEFLYRELSEVPQEARHGYVLPSFAKEYLEGKEYRANRRLLDYFESCGIHTIKAGTGTPEVRNEAGKIVKRAVRAVVECGFHSLRYSYISHNAELGTPAAVIQKNAGHANPAMTEHYTRISDRAAIQYANAMKLPMPEDSAVIDAEIIVEEPERAELRNLVDSLSIEQIKVILANIKGA